MFSRYRRSLSLALFGTAIALSSSLGCSSQADDSTAEANETAVSPSGPFYVIGSFDGSQGFAFWNHTMTLARSLTRETKKPVHFTYFVNGAHFTLVTGAEAATSECGAAMSMPEIRTRFAVAQQAIDEGHEIGSHSMFHKNGGEWWGGEWNADIGRMASIISANLFDPVRDETGALVFPKWVPRGEGRALGAACKVASDCDSGICSEMAEGKAFCSKECNYDNQCPTDMACGGPGWKSTFAQGDATVMDLCVPKPAYPVTFKGKVLFDENGEPNKAEIDSSPDKNDATKILKPYKMVGIRAPYLAMPFGAPPGDDSGRISAPLWSALGRNHFRYSSSQGGLMGTEQRANVAAQRGLWELPLVPAIKDRPMTADTVYRKPPSQFRSITSESGTIPVATMRADYKQGILARYAVRGKGTRHLGLVTHFSAWETDSYSRTCAPHGWTDKDRWQSKCGESYYNAWADTIEWAARGCPSDAGTKECPDVVVGSYLDLLPTIDADAAH